MKKNYRRALHTFLVVMMICMVVLGGCKPTEDESSSLSNASTESSDASSELSYTSNKTTSEEVTSSDQLQTSSLNEEESTEASEGGDGWISIPTQNQSRETETKSNVSSNKTSSNEPTPGDNKDPFSKVPASLKGKQVRVLTWWTPGTAEKNKAAAFTKKTGIKVKFDAPVSLEDYYSTLAARISANNAPDVGALNGEYFPIYITKRLFRPISEGAFDLTDSKYDKNLMDFFKWNNTYYGVSIKGSSTINYLTLYWNKALFREKGITTTPETLWRSNNWNWDTLLDLAKKMTDSSRNLHGLASAYNWYWSAASGTDFIKITDKGIQNNSSDRKIYNAYKFAWDLKNTHNVSPPEAVHADEFYNRKVAMYVTESFLMQSGNYLDKHMKDDWGVAPLPSPKGQKFVVGSMSHIWGLPNRSKQPEAASWYIRYWLDPEYDQDKIYATPECQKLIDWMIEQPRFPYLSMGVLSYGGEYHYWWQEHELSFATPSDLQSTLDSWGAIYAANIKSIMNEYES